MPEGHTLHRLARVAAGPVRRPAGPRDQPAGPLRRRRARRRPRARRRDGPRQAPVRRVRRPHRARPPRAVRQGRGRRGRAAAAAWARSACAGSPTTGWTDLRGPTACEVLSPSEVDAILARLGPDPLRRAARRRPGVRPHRPQPGADRRPADGPGGAWPASATCTGPRSSSATASTRTCPGRLLDESRWRAAVGRPRDADAGRPALGPDRHDRAPADRARRRGTARREDAHYVYRRAGLPCRICGTPVAMQELGRPQALLVPGLPGRLTRRRAPGSRPVRGGVTRPLGTG